MKKYTRQECLKIMDSVNFPRGLHIAQTGKVLWWTIFNHKRFYKFIEGIEKGYALHFAFKYAYEYPM